ncbi:MAG: bile acid:sodium symporter, partial [Myxococcota bacterium]
MNYVTQVALPLSLAFIMFAMGLGLTRADFARVIVQPRDFLVGAVLQTAVLPVVAFAIASLWSLTPELAVGIMLLAACPGGTTSNLLTHMARGDVALSISLTAVISLAGVFTIPLVLGTSLQYFIGADAPPLPLLKTIIGIFFITTVPVIIGMFVRAKSPRFAAWAEPKSRPLVTAMFVLIVVGAVVSERKLILANLDSTILTVI